MKSAIVVLAAVMALTPAPAADKPFEKGQPVTLQPDQGYVLVRSFERHVGGLVGSAAYSPILIRVLSPDEIAKAEKNGGSSGKNEANVVIPPPDHPYAKVGNELFLLMPLKPGTYVLGGVNSTDWNMNYVTASLCMGTVKFEVKPGVVTDLGTLLNTWAYEPTSIPELAKIVVGKHIDFAPVDDVAIRPVTPATETPETLKTLPIVPADYRAVGWIPNYLGAHFSRLAPIAGVIDYDKDGNVIDLKAAP